MDLDLAAIPPDKLEGVLANFESEKRRRVEENQLAGYRAYPKQVQFHRAGLKYRERLLMAANQSGKTLAGGMEAAMHATGLYPQWWKGRRFDRPTVAWVAGETAETVRDTIQRVLVGRTGRYGTGTIPKDTILDIVAARGVPEAIDIIRVRHVSGGASTIGIKSYADGRAKFQGETLDWAWLDEEPPPEIYTECLTRTNVGNGPVWITFTPLLGMSETVRRFLTEISPDRHFVQMDIQEAQHFSPEERKRIIASYPAHEREARTKGIPTLGSGRIFPIAEEGIAIERRDFPSHWPRIGGLDFGWTHPSAAVELAWDRDTDVVYVTKAFRISEIYASGASGHAARLGQNSMGLAKRRSARDARRCRQAASRSVQGAGSRYAARTCAAHGWQCLGRGRPNGNADPHGGRSVQGVQAFERLV